MDTVKFLALTIINAVVWRFIPCEWSRPYEKVSPPHADCGCIPGHFWCRWHRCPCVMGGGYCPWHCEGGN